MLDQDQKRPLGMVLQSAGLISLEQLAKALKIQAEYTQMKLGEILILQEAIQPQTIDFFVDQWQEIRDEGKQLFLGQYLQDAHLLNSEQTQFILTEQQKRWRLFGEIAVEQGWIKQITVDFFVNSLSVKVPRLISFDILEKYNDENLHLERKYTNHEAILTRIIAWTGGNHNLSKLIAQEFAKANFNMPAGREINAVDKFIEGGLIQQWQTIEAGKYLRYAKYQLLNNKRQDSVLLLETYREILLAGAKKYDQSDIQNELLVLGLIIEKDNQIRPSNLIYQQVFHQDWIAAQIAKLRFTSKIKPESSKPIKDDRPLPINDNNMQKKANGTPPVKSKNSQISTFHNQTNSIQKNPRTSTSKANLSVNQDLMRQKNTENANNKALINDDQQNAQANSIALEPITKLGSLFTLFGIILFIPLILIINNYYSPVQSNNQLGDNPLQDKLRLQQFCQDLNLLDPKTSLSLITQLEQNKQEINSEFPDNFSAFPHNCELALNRLRVLTAPQLGRENRVIEAIKNLCKVPADSESLTEAKIWLDNWYDSPGWGQQTRAYLALTPECAANDR